MKFETFLWRIETEAEGSFLKRYADGGGGLSLMAFSRI